jgi:hypothetical protein
MPLKPVSMIDKALCCRNSHYGIEHVINRGISWNLVGTKEAIPGTNGSMTFTP